MYCKKKPIQGTNTANTNNQKILVKSEQGTLTPRYEMSNKKACLPTPFAPTALQTTAMEIETDETEPVYEITEPIDYDEMS